MSPAQPAKEVRRRRQGMTGDNHHSSAFDKESQFSHYYGITRDLLPGRMSGVPTARFANFFLLVPTTADPPNETWIAIPFASLGADGPILSRLQSPYGLQEETLGKMPIPAR
jgi:hypothetical protein